MMQGRKLEVFYHGNHVGTLAEMPDKRVAFQYDLKWQKDGFSINPLNLPLSNDVYIPPKENIRIFHGLFGTFGDSLPDAWGELLMRNFLSDKGVDIGQLSVLDRLAYVGNSGMGALEYYPNHVEEFSIDTAGMDFDSLAVECSKILSSKESDKLDFIYKLAGSSGGTRPKIFLMENGEEWIVKFPANTDPADAGKREYDYSLCAGKCKISMSKTELISSHSCGGYFKTKRFDREDGKKIFTSTFAGILNADFGAPSCDYSTYMKLIRVLTRDRKADLQEMFRLMCFNVLTHNRDDHAKNFSFIYTENGGFRLSPAYDITYSDTYYGEQTTSVNGKGKDISDEDFKTVGELAGLSKKWMEECLEEIRDNIKDLDEYINGATGKRRKKVKMEKRLGVIE